ncbi:MAG: hypothetical protein ACK45H_10725 [Bacteroidota bacterium]|jgi:cytochrome c
MKKSLLPLSILILLSACTPKTAEIKAVTEGPEFPSAEVEEGSHIYANNCGKCHDLPKESRYSEEQWKKIIPPMAGKAKLDATQESKVLQYVLWKSAE